MLDFVRRKYKYDVTGASNPERILQNVRQIARSWSISSSVESPPNASPILKAALEGVTNLVRRAMGDDKCYDIADRPLSEELPTVRIRLILYISFAYLEITVSEHIVRVLAFVHNEVVRLFENAERATEVSPDTLLLPGIHTLVNRSVTKGF